MIQLDEKVIDSFLKEKVAKKKLSGVAVAVKGPDGFSDRKSVV